MGSLDGNEYVRLCLQNIFEKMFPREFEEMLSWLAMDEEEKINTEPLKELWDQAMAEKLPSTAVHVDWDRVFNRL